MRPSRNKILFLFALGFGLLASVIVVPPALAQLSAINEGLSYGTIVGWSTQDLRVTIMKIIQVLFWFLVSLYNNEVFHCGVLTRFW